MNDIYALVGKNIDYSFSRNYFTKKFEREDVKNSQYVNFDIQNIDELTDLLRATPNLRGMNVTIPYKRDIMKFLIAVDPTAYDIGAVNTIQVTPKGLIGYNTDCYGFRESLRPLLQPHHTFALIFGTGGASSAVAYALKQLGISTQFVSRTPKEGQLAYDELTPELFQKYTLIVNCTPLGTFPNITDCPPIPYEYITPQHLLYDLIYNPSPTTFLRRALQSGARAKDGLEMLHLQADKAWQLWTANEEE